MADYIQKDNPLRFPEAGTDWYEEVGVGTGTPVTTNDLIGSTLTYTYSGNTIIYDYDNEVDTWTGRVTRVAAPIPPTECLWEETGNKLYPKTLTNNVGIGTSSPQAKLDVNGNISGHQAFFSTSPGTSGAVHIGESGVSGWNTTFLANGDARISGSVGIGTDSPLAKLDVNGTVRATVFDLEALPALP